MVENEFKKELQQSCHCFLYPSPKSRKEGEIKNIDTSQ